MSKLLLIFRDQLILQAVISNVPGMVLRLVLLRQPHVTLRIFHKNLLRCVPCAFVPALVQDEPVSIAARRRQVHGASAAHVIAELHEEHAQLGGAPRRSIRVLHSQSYPRGAIEQVHALHLQPGAVRVAGREPAILPRQIAIHAHAVAMQRVHERVPRAMRHVPHALDDRWRRRRGRSVVRYPLRGRRSCRGLCVRARTSIPSARVMRRSCRRRAQRERWRGSLCCTFLHDRRA